MKSSLVRAASQRKRSQLQSGNPTLGALFQQIDHVRRQFEAHHIIQKGGRFSGSEAQGRGAQFEQLAAGAQPGQRERRIGATADDHVHVRGEMLQQESHTAMNGGCADHMIVVQDQHALPIDRDHRVDDDRQNALPIQLGRRSQQLAGVCQFGNGTERVCQAGDQIRAEGDGIIITRVQRVPGHGDFPVQQRLRPLGEQRGLAVTGRRANQHQSSTRLEGELFKQAGAWHDPWPWGRHTYLGENQG